MTYTFDVSTKTYPNLWATIDEADRPLLEGRKWHAAKRKNGFYVVGKRGRTAIYLHRLLLSPPDGVEVDHVDGDTLNNRRANLSPCSHQENMAASVLRRFGPKPPPTPRKKARPHVVRMTLRDGTVKEYVYPPRTRRRANEMAQEL